MILRYTAGASLALWASFAWGTENAHVREDARKLLTQYVSMEKDGKPQEKPPLTIQQEKEVRAFTGPNGYGPLFEICAENLELGDKTQNFSEFSAKAGSGVTLISTDIFTGIAPVTTKAGNWFVPKSIGFELTGSVPAQSAKLRDYADHQLLLKDGGLFNGYLSAAASAVWHGVNKECKAARELSFIARGYSGAEAKRFAESNYQRPFIPSRTYVVGHPVVPFIRPYVTHGLGAKAINTDLEDESDEAGDEKEKGKMAGAGVLYLGIGASGPMYDISKFSTKSSAGTLDVQAVGTITWINSSTLSKLYKQEVDDNIIYSLGARFSIMVSDSVSLLLEYATPLGSPRDYMGDVSVFSIAYNVGAPRKAAEEQVSPPAPVKEETKVVPAEAPPAAPAPAQ